MVCLIETCQGGHGTARGCFGADHRETGLSLQEPEADVPDMFSDDIIDSSPVGGRRQVDHAPPAVLRSSL